MSKHTQGPWKAHNTVGAGWSVKTAKPREGGNVPDPICALAWWQFDIPGVIDNEISEANANLLAAAPEMLDALRDAVRLLEHLGVNSNFQKFAIAKATGETTDGMLVEIDAVNGFES